MKIIHEITHLGVSDSHTMKSRLTVTEFLDIKSDIVHIKDMQETAKRLNSLAIKAALFGDIKESIREVIRAIRAGNEQKAEEHALNTIRLIEEKIDD